MDPLRPERISLDLTAAGRVFVPFALASLILAWIAGGVLALFSATAVALLLFAPLLSRAHLRGLRAGPPSPAQVTVGESFVLEIPMSNSSRWLQARDVVLTCGEGPSQEVRPAGHLLSAKARESKRVAVVQRLLERGRKRRLDLVAASSFPLGLVRCRLHFSLPVDLLGLPRLGSLNQMGWLPPGRPRLLQEDRHAIHGQEEFYGVRDWREGEGLRRVHWRLTARRGRRIVREMRHEVEAPVHVLLATCVEPKVPVGSEKRLFERSVSLAATVAEHFLRRGRSVRLTLAGPEPAGLGAQRGRAGLLRILVALAEVERSEADPVEALRTALAAAAPVGEVTIACLVDGRGASKRPGLPREAVLLDVASPSLDEVFLQGRPWGTRPPVAPAR